MTYLLEQYKSDRKRYMNEGRYIKAKKLTPIINVMEGYKIGVALAKSEGKNKAPHVYLT